LAGGAPPFLHDDLVDTLAGDIEVLGKAGLASLHERAVVEHVADCPAESFCALGIAFGHVSVSDTLDTRSNGPVAGALRAGQLAGQVAHLGRLASKPNLGRVASHGDARGDPGVT
jgi:hypothetical protein